MRRYWLLPLILALSGCQSLRDTEIFYKPTTENVYQPLPKEAVIPILSEPPPWPHRTIGQFALQSPRGYKFIQQALIHNARRNGADAVVLRKLNFDLRRTYNYIPPQWENIPQTNVFYQNVRDSNGKWVTVPQVYTSFIPVFRPGRTFVNDVQWVDVSADMVVHKSKRTWSPPLSDSTYATRYLPSQTTADR